MAVLVTGAAGFIGSYVAHALLDRGDEVVGVDNLNDYYDVALKDARLGRLADRSGFSFHKLDISDEAELKSISSQYQLSNVVHLAAQAGVRYSIDNPMAYAKSNLVGHLSILELCRHSETIDHLVYASSSSVYGIGNETPYSELDRVDKPVSLYAATKRADELMSYAYAGLYDFPQTGLRFFTVYGPWGRPDMAYWKFTDAIMNGRPIDVYNNGDMYRDYSYIDDIVSGVLSALDNAPSKDEHGRRHRVFNIGNKRPENLMHFIEVIEDAVGKKAEKRFLEMQPGDVYETCADTSAIEEACGFSSKTSIDEGIPKFVEWFRGFNGEK